VRVALGLVLLAVAGGAGGLALAADGGGHPGTRTVKTTVQMRRVCPQRVFSRPVIDPAGQPDAGVLAAFGVLRRPATPADAVPAAVLRRLSPFVDGVLSGAARLVRGDAPGTRVWMVPVRVANRAPPLPAAGCRPRPWIVKQPRATPRRRALRRRATHPSQRAARARGHTRLSGLRTVPSHRRLPAGPIPPPAVRHVPGLRPLAPGLTHSHLQRVPMTPQPGVVFLSESDDGPSQAYPLDAVHEGVGVSGNFCAGPSRDMLAFSGPAADGVASVTVVNRDGSSVQADVTNNVYVLMLAKPATAAAGPDHLEWTDATGTSRTAHVYAGRGATIHCAPLPDFSVGRRVAPSRAPIELALPTPPGTPGMPALVTLVRHVGSNTTCAATGTPDGERGVHEDVTSSISCFSAPTIRNRRFMLRATRMTGDRTLLTGMVDRRIVRWLTVERGPSPEQGAFRMSPSRSGVVTAVFHGSFLHGATWTVTAALRERGRILVSRPVKVRLRSGSPPPAPTSPARRVDPVLLARYAVLRRPRTPADVMPANALGLSNVDVNPLFSRLAAAAGSTRVYVVPGDQDLCLVSVQPHGSTGACTRATPDMDQPVSIQGGGPRGARRWIVLFVDGTRDVRGIFRGGVTRSYTPRDNVIILVTRPGRGLRALRFTTSDGTRHTLF
jgi:hypothetical protein